MSKCQCDLRTKLVGDGCRYCNAQEYIDKLIEALEELIEALEEQRTWVGLTDNDLEKLKLLTFEKEINADGEEQEAVNLDQLIRATEQLCKEKNHE